MCHAGSSPCTFRLVYIHPQPLQRRYYLHRNRDDLKNNKCVYFVIAGYLVPAMELLRDQSSDITLLDSHLILLKFLANADEISLAVEHLKWIQGKSPLMHQALSNEILASIASSSKSDPIFKLFQVMQGNRLNSTNDLGKEMAYR